MSTDDMVTSLKAQLADLSLENQRKIDELTAKVEALEKEKKSEKKHTRAYEVVYAFMDEYATLTGEIVMLRRDLNEIENEMRLFRASYGTSANFMNIRFLAERRDKCAMKLHDLSEHRTTLSRAILEAADTNFQ